jgi:hypothetical protein
MSIRSVRTVEIPQGVGDVAHMTASASTLQELITTIPRAYQAILGDHLTRKYRVAHKHANVQSTVSMYERHDTDGSYPPVIRNSLKEPKLQFAKEFLQTTTGSKSPDNFQSAIAAARKAALASALLEKKKELEYLGTLIRA